MLENWKRIFDSFRKKRLCFRKRERERERETVSKRERKWNNGKTDVVWELNECMDFM